jgi:multidrug resistance efflux pump
MSELKDRFEIDDVRGEPDDAEFDEEALWARRRQFLLTAGTIAILIGAILAIPWRAEVDATGRVAPHRWARVYSEAPGVIREVTRRSGDPVEPGEVIAVLDSDEQRDALEAARLVLTRERQKLADLELRLRENAIQREGAEAVAKIAAERAIAAQQIDESQIAALDPIADKVLDGVRRFTTQVRAELSRNRAVQAESVLPGEELYQRVRDTMDRYFAQAAKVAEHLVSVAGPEAGRQFKFELEDLRFAYVLADHSMEEILEKRGLVEQGLIPAAALRELNTTLERETIELAQGFRVLSSSVRSLLGSRAEHDERVRSAEEIRRLLANEAERLEAERASVLSEIAAAELAVRAAERHQGKTAIRAPIRGTLTGESPSRFDVVSANVPVAVIEDADRLVLKLRVNESDVRRVEVGQPVDARTYGGRRLKGFVAWSTPLAGQEVRDQEWNVLIELDGEHAGVEPGEKVMASIDVGRRSLLARWFGPSEPAAAEPRFAFVEDPTELREPTDTRPLLGATMPEQVAPEGIGLRSRGNGD